MRIEAHSCTRWGIAAAHGLLEPRLLREEADGDELLDRVGVAGVAHLPAPHAPIGIDRSIMAAALLGGASPVHEAVAAGTGQSSQGTP